MSWSHTLWILWITLCFGDSLPPGVEQGRIFFICYLNSYSQAVGKLKTVTHQHILPSKYLFISCSSSFTAIVPVKIEIINVYLQPLLAKTLTQVHVSWWWDTTWNAQRCTVYTCDLQINTDPLWKFHLIWIGFENIRPWKNENLKTQMQFCVLQLKMQADLWRE